MKVSVLGAGNGGCALAFHLAQMGHEVLLYQDKQFEHLFKEIVDTGKIVALQETGGVAAEIHGEASIAKTTTDVKEACEFSNFLMLIVPAYAQGVTFKLCLPHLTPDHVFISLPGNFAFLEYVKIIHEASGSGEKVDILALNKSTTLNSFVETSTIPYACRLLGGNKVFIGGTKKQMEVGVFPSGRTGKVVDSIKSLFTLTLKANKNVIETGFCNLNFILHPPIMVYNAGRIESTKGNFLFYKEGLMPCVASLMKALDRERIAIANALLLKIDDLESAWRKWYNIPDLNDITEIPVKGKPYQFVKAPDTLNNRYITEDLNYVLVPIIKYLAKPLNVPTPVADAIITSAQVLSGLSVEPARHFDSFLKEYIEM